MLFSSLMYTVKGYRHIFRKSTGVDMNKFRFQMYQSSLVYDPLTLSLLYSLQCATTVKKLHTRVKPVYIESLLRLKLTPELLVIPFLDCLYLDGINWGLVQSCPNFWFKVVPIPLSSLNQTYGLVNSFFCCIGFRVILQRCYKSSTIFRTLYNALFR